MFTGTILPLKASGHAFNDEIDTQPVSWDNVEVRVDARVGDAQGLHDLGFQIGDTVAVMANPEVTPEGFIVSRHLDGKAGVAAALSVVKTIQDLKIELPYRTRLMVTIAEEVGHGATHGLEGVSEMISVDNAVCAPGGQNSIEHGVTIPMADQVGPFEYHLTRKLLRLADEHEIACVRDTFPLLPLRCGGRDRGRGRNPGPPWSRSGWMPRTAGNAPRSIRSPRWSNCSRCGCRRR